jgi:hypothetical protein
LDTDNGKEIVPHNGGGVFNELSIRIKLIFRLLLDKRVNPLLKLLPIGSLVYLIFPDILFGPVDDAILIWLGGYLFIELCPNELVQEHMDALTQVIEGEWREIDEEEREA